MLLEQARATEDEIKAIDAEVKAIVAEAVQFAQESPEPDSVRALYRRLRGGVSLRFRPILLGFLIAAAMCGAASAQTTLSLPAHLVQVTPAQRASGERWMAARGIQYAVSYDPDGRIAFSYAGATHRLTETQFLNAVQAFLNDSTLAVVERVSLENDHDARLAELTYYENRGDRDGFLYAWPAGYPQVVKLNYRLRLPTNEERTRGFVGALLCVDRGAGSRTVCSPAYEMLIGYHGRHAGDPLGLHDQTLPGNLTLESVWPDGTPLIPERAPQDAALLGLTQ